MAQKKNVASHYETVKIEEENSPMNEQLLPMRREDGGRTGLLRPDSWAREGSTG
jgi:hypothetical protein